MDRHDLEDARHWVIKLGSAVFLRDTAELDRSTFVSLVEGICGLLGRGHRVTLVSSGAVALGREYLEWPDPQREDIPYQQALAAMGQSRLMKMYSNEFGHHGHRVAQVLFTRGDLSARRRFFNARVAIDELAEQGAIPIINENDTVATEELRFGDNDQLAGMACGVVDADVLVLLTHVEGIFDVIEAEDEPRFGARISSIDANDAYLDEIAGPSGTSVGTGGMQSKVDAARLASRLGVPTVIANGKSPGILDDIRSGTDVGTFLRAERTDKQLSGKKLWLGAGARSRGTVRCDEGAAVAIKDRGGSLLPTGVVAVEGDFEQGAVVDLVLQGEDEPFGRGVAVYGADEIERIKGEQSTDIADILGYRVLDTVLHRDSLVVF